MGASVRPEATDNPRLARIRAVIRHYASQGAPAEDIQALIEQNHPELVATPAGELAAMPRTAMEEVRGAAQSLTQGATFNFGDEIVAGIRAAMDAGVTFPEALADERASLDAFRAANPKTAFALEATGGMTSGVAGMRAATRLAPRLATTIAANPLKTAAVAGGVAGAGAGEDAVGRTALAAGGAVAAPLVTAGVQRLATSRAGDLLREGFENITAGNPQIPANLRPAVPMTAPAATGATGGATTALPARVPTPGTAVVRASQPTPPVASSAAAPAAPAAAGAMDAGEAVASGRIRTTPGRRLAARAIVGEDGARAAEVRRQLAEWERLNMGEDVTLLTAGGRPTAEAARTIANAPMSTAAETMDAVLARQGSRLGAKVGQDIAETTGQGAVPGPIRLRAMQHELERRTGEAFDAFRGRGDIGTLTLSDDAARQFGKYVAAVRRNNPTLAALPETDAQVVDEAFKLLQEEVRAKGRGTAATAARGVKDLRNRVLDAIEQVDPDYGRVVRQYALDEDVGKVAQEAFTRGMDLPTAPVGTFTAEAAGKAPFIAESMRTGASARLVAQARDAAANIDLGKLAKFRNVAEGVMGRQGQADRFREIFGTQAYKQLLERLSPKIQAAALNAVVRGNSTTARQMLAAMAEGDQAVLDVLEGTMRGGPMAAALSFAARKVVNPARAAVTGAVGDAASEAAQLIGTRGTKRGKTVLDALEAMAKQDATRRKATRPLSGAVVRAGVNR